MTICQQLTLLLEGAISSGRSEDVNTIRSCFIMAKKMSKRLEEYKTGVKVDKDCEDVWNRELDTLTASME